jgi:hypothetical protein
VLKNDWFKRPWLTDMRALNVVFRDFALLLAAMLVILVWVMLPHLHEPTKAQNAEIDAPGSILVHAIWPNGNDDIDLWLTSPDDSQPVYFSNKNGVLWDLLRDDMGLPPDESPINFENAFTRGIKPGEYIVNVHCYRCPEAPFDVDVVVSYRDPHVEDASLVVIMQTKVRMMRDKQERTAVRFTVNDDLKVDAETIHTVYKKLVTYDAETDVHQR